MTEFYHRSFGNSLENAVVWNVVRHIGDNPAGLVFLVVLFVGFGLAAWWRSRR